jgi:hypothetical protein
VTAQSPLPVKRVAELAASPPKLQWLVDALWSDQAVGVIGGEPKSCKSFLALDVAVSVASGASSLRRFSVPNAGPVLLFAAEDALEVVRRRIEGIALARAVDFSSLNIHVITADAVRLDIERDRHRLWATLESIRPKLLVLDPFVRLHRCDENVTAEVVPLLAYLREIQRYFATAVLLVHHARKTAHPRAGQALRGSSEIHAWGDSYLYLRRGQEGLRLSVEHRAAPAIDGLSLELHQEGAALALRIVDDPPQNPSAPPTLQQRILDALAQTDEPVSQRKLREACRVRASSLSATLDQLIQQRLVNRTSTGYLLAQ